ncbi:hypothetical protein [Paraferrimonas sedimenticola]|uniref:Uncharacterized protein n=1 Tax=Paraferrimonas sedimenticola TaxID=375674 RepID=A0AA37RQY1_9GAMM|nr:hypothetical protein [Paraferrimonas sedimenticola]GLP95003.1 hypothetical protein GCM10007895_03090 [Paraferrimonas sedimenticola]
MKSIYRASIATAILLAMPGCKSTEHAAEANMPLASTEKVIEFSNELGNVDLYEVNRQLQEAILKYSSYRPYGPKKLTMGYSNTYNKGIKVRTSSNKVTVDYASSMKDNGRKFTSYKTAEMTVSGENNDGKFKVTIKSPNSINVHTGKAFVFPINHLDSNENIAKDLAQIHASLDKIIIEKNSNFKHESVSDYGVDSVISNFERKYSVQNVRSNIANGKAISFRNSINGSLVTIEVSPYRNGSIAVSRHSIPYTLFADGTASTTKAELESLADRIYKEIDSVVKS